MKKVKTILKIVLPILLGVTVVSFLLYGPLLSPMWSRHQLRTANPGELLSACRIVMTNHAAYRKNPGCGGDQPSPDPTDPKMPKAIRRLRPLYMVVSDDYLEVVMPGRHTVVFALPEGKKPEGSQYFGPEIIEGLYGER